ncbi:outer membrane protein assembly factor BamC [Psychromonas sp. KJ10-10]|uniref:outer membrane protein assembly factor BamC n=1 Tax=Psychromonas sp. KJ10-10 TaxID=3391823 RepID=UPI0039B54BB3
MKLTLKHNRRTLAVIIALSLTGCVRFDTRMQANSDFEYSEASLEKPYSTGDFSNDEARNTFAIPELTEQQKQTGYTLSDVDVRPPTQFTPVIDGVVLDSSSTNATKIWFNAFKQNEDIEARVWSLINAYLNENNVQVVNRNDVLQSIETGTFIEQVTFGSFFNTNSLTRESSYKLSVDKLLSGHSVSLTVDALNYRETNEGVELKFDLEGKRKSEIETRFVNKLLEFAYMVKENEQLENADKQPLDIKLGFDDNHQNAWIVDSEFVDTWRKIPTLFTLLNFDIVEKDKNLGYFLLKFDQPDQDYWQENNLKPFELDEAEYFVQLGELTGGVTSLSWLDEDKNPLSDQKITELYLSITEHLRDALIESEKQTKEF